MMIFEENTAGRDFIISDLHGCYDKLGAAMVSVNFDTKVDRMFSVGDLIDRGPDSLKIIERILREPWFHPVMGNHEKMFLSCWITKTADEWWHINNGGSWVLDLSDKVKREIGRMFSNLPLAIQVGDVGITHSVIPEEIHWKDVDRHEEQVLWSRHKENIYHSIPGIRKAYCGHSIHKGPVSVYKNLVNIDTGAFLEGGKLTILEI